MALLLAVAGLALAGAAWWFFHRRRLARRRREVVAWLQGGGEVFGGAAARRWAAAGRLGRAPRLLRVRVEQAAPPFRALSLAVRLGRLRPGASGRGRLVGRRRGLSDRLVVEAELVRAPRAEFDVFYPAGAIGREALDAAAAAGWRVSEVGEACSARLGALRLAEPPGPPAAPREGLLQVARRVEELSAELRRLAVRRRPPHLLAIAVSPAASGQVSAQALFDLLREAAELALGPASPAPLGPSGEPPGASRGPLPPRSRRPAP